jgi:hypothetical protein
VLDGLLDVIGPVAPYAVVVGGGRLFWVMAQSAGKSRRTGADEASSILDYSLGLRADFT